MPTCSEWLWEYMDNATGVFIPSSIVFEDGKIEGFTKTEIKQARKDIGISSICNPKTVGMGNQNYWFIPPWLEGVDS